MLSHRVRSLVVEVVMFRIRSRARGLLKVLGAAVWMPLGLLASCTTTSAQTKHVPEEGVHSYQTFEKLEPLDTFGELEDDAENYPWLRQQNVEAQGPLGDASVVSPYSEESQLVTSKRSSSFQMKKASKRAPKGRAAQRRRR